jgi:hypothetical protein
MEVGDKLELRKFVTLEIVFGEGALNLTGQYAISFGARKVLLVTDPGVRAAGWVGGWSWLMETVTLFCWSTWCVSTIMRLLSDTAPLAGRWD